MGSTPVFPPNAYNPTPPSNPYGVDSQTGVYSHTVDKVIGSAYDTVRFVAEQIEYIKHVSAHLAEIYRVHGSIEAIDALYANIEMLDTLYQNLEDILKIAELAEPIEAIYANLDAIIAVSAKLTEIAAVYESLPQIIDVAAINEEILLVAANIDSVIHAVDYAAAAEQAATIAMDASYQATQARDEAEEFRDETAVLAGSAAANVSELYPTIAAGLAATTDGEYFLVKGTNGGTIYASLYQNVGGTAVDQQLQIASLGALKEYPKVVTGDSLALVEETGVGALLGPGGVFAPAINEIEARGWKITYVEGYPGGIVFSDESTGMAQIIAYPPADPLLGTTAVDTVSGKGAMVIQEAATGLGQVLIQPLEDPYYGTNQISIESGNNTLSVIDHNLQIRQDYQLYGYDPLYGPYPLMGEEGDGGLYIKDSDTGLGMIVGGIDPLDIDEPEVPTIPGVPLEEYFTHTQYDYVENRALIEAKRLNSQDVKGFAKRAVTAGVAKVLRIGTGQSFMAGSGQAHTFLSATRLANYGFTNIPALSIGPDPRCVTGGPTFVPYSDTAFTATINDGSAAIPAIAGNVMTVTFINHGMLKVGQVISGTGVTAGTTIVSQSSGTTGSTGVYVVSVSQLVGSTTIRGKATVQELFTLKEQFIYQTGTDNMYNEGQFLVGNYTYNARGGTPETVREVLSWVLRNRWNLRTDKATQLWQTVSMNHAKTDGLLSEISGGDGLLRMYSLIDLFVASTTGTRLCDLIHMEHGQADEMSQVPGYKVGVETYYENIWTKLQSSLGQVAPPIMIQHQVGGPKYGLDNAMAANDQVAMMLDLTGTSANIFLIGADYETPSFYFYGQDQYSGFPNSPIWDHNGHPLSAGNSLFGIRGAIGIHYILDREESYWIPFPYECYYDDNKFLVSIPSKFPPLQIADMVCGVELVMLDSLGISFEDGSGNMNPVLSARLVPGYKTLIEGICEHDIAGYSIMKTGKRVAAFTISGFTNIRDSFDISLPFELPFDKAQTYFPLETRDDPMLNGLGRWLEDIPGWVGKPNLGNPCARYTVNAVPIP